MNCSLCPRKCGVARPDGFCRMPDKAVIARAAPHFFEEPCISGKNGSGAVFFCGCNLRCVFCQNRSISRAPVADSAEFDSDGLRRVFDSLVSLGVHNINLVTPTHFSPVIAGALEKPLPVPAVWNSGGYESVDTIALLRGKIQIYMPDMKYSDEALARRLSLAPDYPDIAGRALLEMYRQVGRPVFDPSGLLLRGMIIRHLVLPGLPENTRGVIDFVYDNFPRGSVLFSLMGQYTPPSDAAFAQKYPSLARPLTAGEYEEAVDYLRKRHINDGFLQYPEASGEEYIPDFGRKYIL